MQKVYLLLRDNKQSGPYSLEELLQLHPRPFDLIWIEGRSCGWSYPSEIEALRPYVPAAAITQSTPAKEVTPEPLPPTHQAYTPSNDRSTTARAASPHIFVSMPYKAVQQPLPAAEPSAEDSLERKAEELRRRAQAYAAQRPAPPVEEELTTRYARPLDDVEEEYTNWVVEHKIKKKSRKSGKGAAVALVVVVVLAGGYLAGRSLLGGKEAEPVRQAARVPEKAQQVSPQVPEEEPPADPAHYSTASTEPVTQKQVVAKEKTITAKKPAASRRQSVPQPRANDSTPYWQEETPLGEEALAGGPAVVEEAAPAVAAPSGKEKKKSLGEKIDGFFDKLAGKKKTGSQASQGDEEPVQRSTQPGDSERRSVRRGEGETRTVDPAVLARQVEVVGNNPDNWMMGVRDLKLTVRNRSSETLKNAAVEVSYYTEEKSLLEKKVVYVTDVPPGKAKTIKAPDQRLADHADYRILSVTPAEGY